LGAIAGFVEDRGTGAEAHTDNTHAAALFCGQQGP
jgi:hypothetical protein